MSSLDLAVLESLERDLGDREVVREVVRMYLELLPERRRAVAQAASRTDDPTRLRRDAHTLGSASAVIGAVELRGLCRELEAAQLPQGGAAFEQLVSAWASSCAETEDALTAWLDAS